MAHWTPEKEPADALTSFEVQFLIDLYILAGGDPGAISIGSSWFYDQTPTGTVNGVNLSFTLPVSATQVVVYADGVRVKGGGDTYTHSGSSINFVSGKQPYSSISVDYTTS